MLYQAGRLLFVSPDLELVHVGRLSKFSIGRKNTLVTASGFPFDVGPVQELDSASQKSEWTLKITQESIDELDLQFVLDQREATASSIVLPGSTTKVVVPSSSPYEVTVTGLTVDQEVKATVVSDTDPKYLEQVASAGSPATGQFEVTANKIAFHADQAGKTVAIYYLETLTSQLVIGGNTAIASYGVCSFKGIIKGTRTTKHFYLPRISYLGDFELQVGDKSEIGMEFKMLTPADWNAPYASWDVA